MPSQDKYRQDDTLDKGFYDQENSILNTLVAGLVVLGSAGLAYKTGLLKHPIQAITKSLDNFSPGTVARTKAMRDWLNLGNGAKETESLFRHMPDIPSLIANNNYRNKAFNATADDLMNLKRNIRSAAAEPYKALSTTGSDESQYASSLFMRYIRESNRVIESSENLKDIVTNKVTYETKTLLRQTQETRASQLKQTGSRSVTLGDFVDVLENGDKFEVRVRSNNKITGDVADVVKDFLARQDADVNGKATGKLVKDTDWWKDIVFDNNLRMLDNGEMVDLRGFKNSMSFVRDIVENEFGIPFIGINPLKFIKSETSKADFTRFAVLDPKSVQPFIPGAKPGRHTFHEEKLFRPMLFINGNIYQQNGNELRLVAENMGVVGINRAHPHTAPKFLDDLRKIADIPLTEVKKRPEGTVRRNLFDLLDLGYQDKKPGFKKPPGYFDVPDKYKEILKGFNFRNLNPDTIAENLPNAVLKRMKATDSRIDRDLFQAFNVGMSDSAGIDNIYIAFNKGTTLKDVVSGQQTVSKYFKDIMEQSFASRKDLSKVTQHTIFAFRQVERLNQALGVVGLGMSTASTGSALDAAKNLVMKRVVPVYIALEALAVANALTETEDKDGNKRTVKNALSDDIVNIDIGFHKVKDALGLTSASKYFEDLFPGLDHLTEIPGIYQLGLSQTADERLEYYQHGKDPVRKGRYWTLGNSPFTGKKIEYWEPNWYQKQLADYKFSDTMYGSRKEYFSNTWYPNLINPFAPVNNLMLDRYHFEKKHYYDRPYLQTAPALTNVPIIGNVLGPTVGSFIKPVVKMHPEYWQEPAVTGDSTGEHVAQVDYNEKGTQYTKTTDPKGNADIIEFVSQDNSEEEFNPVSYVTSGGKASVVSVSTSNDFYELKKDIKKYSAKSIPGIKPRANLISYGYEETSGGITDPNSLSYVLGEQYDTITDVLGLRGFMLKTATGVPNDGKTVTDTPDWAYSKNREFWDKGIGGLGGEISEIFRRFIQKRSPYSQDYHNPIKNEMPSWMPSNDYFIDFSRGDPYTKVPQGEIRLPGEPYERIHGINRNKLAIGSSFLGKSQEDLIKHFMRQDDLMSSALEDIVDEGTEIHNKIERAWLESGLAVDTEGVINDRENNIIGYYDAMLYDSSSKTGLAVADVKSASDKIFNQIKSTGTPKQENVVQLNFYMHNLGMEHGYLHYVNRDKPEEQLSIKVKYSAKLYKDTIKNLNEARAVINKKIAAHEMSPFETYSHMDRLKILADVAPYSQEFQETSAILRRSGMSKEEQEEYSRINTRVRAQKEKLRVYDYRFKNKRFEHMNLTVKKIYDGNKILTEELPNNPIVLSGISISRDKSNEDYQKIQNTLESVFRKGKKIKFVVEEDTDISESKMNNIKAVAYSGNTNLNKYLLGKGVATEDEDDYSATATLARYNALERTFGSVWESIAHLDTPINTKWLQVRSPLEDYKRRQVYGKDFQSWEHPIQSFVLPALNTSVERPSGILWGAIIGSLFGKRTFGRIIGASIGSGIVVAGKAVTSAGEAASGKKWIPKSRLDERELNEYMDVLAYVKNQSLYEKYRQLALDEDEFDVEAYIRGKSSKGNERKKEIRELEKKKKDFKYSFEPTFLEKVLALFGDDLSKERKDRVIEKINERQNELKADRDLEKLPENAIMAIEYYNRAESTMYAYDPGDPIGDLFASIPDKDKPYMKYFMKATGDERKEILDVVPDYLKRPLQSIYGVKVDKKKPLLEYFDGYNLPSSDWRGWDEDVSLEDVKVKIVKKDGRDYGEYGIWKDDVDRANAAGEIPIPDINYRESKHKVQKELYDLLSKAGYERIRIEAYDTSGKMNVNFNLNYERESEIKDRLQRYSG